MMKKVFRLIPASIYDIPSLENWFSQQSENGLRLLSANRIFATFSKEAPEKRTYRLEIITKNNTLLSKEQQNIYQDFGWEYVCCLGGLFHIFSNENKKPMELHTDPIVQSLGYEKISKKLNNDLLWTCILSLYMLWLNYRSIRLGIFDFTAMVEENLPPFILASVLILVLLLLARLFPCLQIRKQLKTLRHGRFPREHSYKFQKLHSGYLHLGIILCFCVMIYYPMTTTQRLSEREYMEQQGKLPFVTLEEIEGLPAVYPIDYSDASTFSEQNDYLYHEDHSMLAPRQFILRQDESRPPRNIENPAYLWMMYVEVSLPSLAEPYYQAKIKDMLPEGAVSVSASELPAAIDEINIYQHQNDTYFFLRKGTETLCIHHQGIGDPLPYLERFSDFLLQENAIPFVSE